jgi:hypothetical protein
LKTVISMNFVLKINKGLFSKAGKNRMGESEHPPDVQCVGAERIQNDFFFVT